VGCDARQALLTACSERGGVDSVCVVVSAAIASGQHR
jgi:hypothetical protein